MRTRNRRVALASQRAIATLGRRGLLRRFDSVKLGLHATRVQEWLPVKHEHVRIVGCIAQLIIDQLLPVETLEGRSDPLLRFTHALKVDRRETLLSYFTQELACRCIVHIHECLVVSLLLDLLGLVKCGATRALLEDLRHLDGTVWLHRKVLTLQRGELS